jgi:DNA mismatch repair protein MutS
LLIDQETVRDLEIFRTRNGEPGIFQILDLTKTQGGRRALRFRFENPMSDPDLISRVQEGVEFLASEEIGFDPNPNLIRDVRAYLDSSWDVASRAGGLRFLMEAGLGALSHRDLFRFARRGVSTAQEMISQILPFLKDLQRRDPPSEVMRPVENLLALVDRLRLGRVSVSRFPWALARADRYLRVERKADFQRFFELLSDLDALISMASAMKAKGLVFPEIVESPEFLLEGEGVFHLFLKNPVGNPVKIGEGKSLVFLTGPNMAGKTTYLKAVAVSNYLAHLGMGVPAKRLRFVPLDRIYSSLRPEESLRDGLSFFMAEVLRAKEIAKAVAGGQRALVLFDEVFRGTNVKDALDASLLVIRGFSKFRGSGFLFSSHLVELAEDLRREDSVLLSCFDGEIRDQQARYDFRVRDGVSDQRLGIQLLEQEGVVEILFPKNEPDR